VRRGRTDPGIITRRVSRGQGAPALGGRHRHQATTGPSWLISPHLSRSCRDPRGSPGATATRMREVSVSARRWLPRWPRCPRTPSIR